MGHLQCTNVEFASHEPYLNTKMGTKCFELNGLFFLKRNSLL